MGVKLHYYNATETDNVLQKTKRGKSVPRQVRRAVLINKGKKYSGFSELGTSRMKRVRKDLEANKE